MMSDTRALPTTQHVKYLVIGAGPGGLQMGYFLQRENRDYLILDRADQVGSFFSRFPRHRTLISINKRYNHFDEDEFNSRHDWNSLLSHDPELRFTHYTDDLFPSADTLCSYLTEFAKVNELNIHFGTEVVSIHRDEQRLFQVSTRDGRQYSCEVLLLGTGAATERKAEILGIEHTTSYGSHSTDLERYRNKRVGIIGQGNSAFETANHLSGTAAYVHILGNRPITMAWNSHFPGDVRAVNNDVFDMFQLKSMHAVLAPRIVRIDKVGDVLRTTHEYDYPNAATPGTLRLTRDYDEIICCTGFNWVPHEIFADDLQPETWKDGKYPSLTPIWESTNIPDLFVIGGAMQGNDRHSASGFIHGYRYNIRVLSRILAERYENVPYPSRREAPFEWQPFSEWLYRRLSTTAALFQLFGTLCDVVVVSPDRMKVTIYEELPVNHIVERDFGDDHVFTVTLEFGFDNYDEPALGFLGPSDPTNTRAAAFLHPVIRYHRGAVCDEFHFGDSLLARWDLPHGSGGAVMGYHEDFRRWFLARLGIDDHGDVAPLDPAFRPWTADEVEAWAQAHPTNVTIGPRYQNPLSTAEGASESLR